MKLTPKKDFIEQKNFANAHRDLVVATPFRTALNAALIDHVLSLPDTNDPATAIACYHQIRGARDFITHLLNIAEQTKAPTTKNTDNLDHNVR